MPGAIAISPKFHFDDANGLPLAGGRVLTYLAGTSTLANTWQDEAQTTLNTNPIILDARGECLVWVSPAQKYRFLVQTAASATIYSVDNVQPALRGAAGPQGPPGASQTPFRSRLAVTSTQSLPVQQQGLQVTAGGSGSYTLTMPDPAAVTTSNTYDIVAVGSVTVTLTTAAGAFSGPPITGELNGTVTTLTLFAGTNYSFVSTGTNWLAVNGEISRGPGYSSGAPYVGLVVVGQTLAANQVVVSARVLTLRNSGGVERRVQLPGGGISINTATVGFNGLDTGALAATTWYDVYVVLRGSLLYAFACVKGATPNVSALTQSDFFARVGTVRSNAGATGMFGTLQVGKEVRYIIGTSTTSLPVVFSGVTGDVTVPTWTAFVTNNAVPPDIAEYVIYRLCCRNATAGDAIVAQTPAQGAFNATNNGPSKRITFAGYQEDKLFLVNNTIYMASNESQQFALIVGWGEQ